MIKQIFQALRHHFRTGRYRKISYILHPELTTGLILDLGGGPASFFSERFPHSEQIVLLEIDTREALRAKEKLSRLQVVVADGEHMPFPDQSIALTICNSVIEHVIHPDQLAKEICRVSHQYFIQTPNGDFPLEPHSLIGIPFYNMIGSRSARRFLCRLFGGNFEYIESVRYLKEAYLRSLFPKSKIEYEKVLGLVKSYYIYRKTGSTE